MKRLLHNRTALGIGSIILALVICLIVAPVISTASSRHVTVVRVTKEIKESTQIKKDMIQAVKIGGYNLPSNIVTDPDKVIGKYATATLQPGDNVLDSKISAQAPNAYLSQLDGKQIAVSVSIKNFAAGLSGKLMPGDIISFNVADYGDLKQTLAPAELRYVKLLAATNDTGVDNTTNAQDKEKSKQEDMPSTLTVLVTPEQMQKLVDYDHNGQLHAGLVYRGTKDNANRFLSVQAKYLKENGSGDENAE
jgi:pilus assembly protein CpaB